MNSHLLEGKVTHRRTRPFTYRLDHPVFYFALDLGELDEVARRLRLVSRNRRNVLSFRDGDHLDPPAVDVTARIRQHLRDDGVEPHGWQVTLVTCLRVFGSMFWPASGNRASSAGRKTQPRAAAARASVNGGVWRSVRMAVTRPSALTVNSR